MISTYLVPKTTMITRMQKAAKLTMTTPAIDSKNDYLINKAFFQSETKENISALLQSGPGLNVRGEGGWTLLHLASKNGSPDNFKKY